LGAFLFILNDSGRFGIIFGGIIVGIMKKMTWWIVCVNWSEVELPEPHSHITRLGTGDRADWADMRWDLDQVVEAIQQGDSFVVVQDSIDPIHAVKAGPCPVCGQMVLSTGDDALMTELQTCSFDRPESDFVYGGTLWG
jgi:hypothetical protein